jgi:hypothetical protein
MYDTLFKIKINFKILIKDIKIGLIKTISINAHSYRKVVLSKKLRVITFFKK